MSNKPLVVSVFKESGVSAANLPVRDFRLDSNCSRAGFAPDKSSTGEKLRAFLSLSICLRAVFTLVSNP